MNSAIITKGLRREFKTVCAVDNLDLEVPRGIVFGFLGPNGSGKTTTIRLLLGLLEPTSGRAEVLGLDTWSRADEVRQNCGALLEHTGLYERLSAVDNLELYGRIWRIPAAARRQRIKDLLDSLGLWDRRNDLVGSWSRGMKQKLAVARAMIHQPDLIFLDEPTAGLDPVAAAALRDDLESLVQKQGVTVFLTTHNLAEAEKLCGMVAVIREGKLLKVGRPDELRRQGGRPHAEVYGRGFTPEVIDQLRKMPEISAVRPLNSHIELDLREDIDMAPLVTWMVTKGVMIEEVRRGQASLEEVFLTLMQEEQNVR